jgi:hypothetical protein
MRETTTIMNIVYDHKATTLSRRKNQKSLSCLFLLTILLGKIQGETMAKIKSAITTKKGHQDATSITNYFDLKNRSFSLILIKIQKLFLA